MYMYIYVQVHVEVWSKMQVLPLNETQVPWHGWVACKLYDPITLRATCMPAGVYTIDRASQAGKVKE